MDGFAAEKIIPANDSVRLLDEISEELDFRNLFRAYSHIGRKPATNPITLFKILAYGGMDGKHTSRELERACNRDINYMWLLGDEKAPNHSEIARFHSKRLSECCEENYTYFEKRNNPVTSSRRIMSAEKPANLRTTWHFGRICPTILKRTNTLAKTEER